MGPRRMRHPAIYRVAWPLRWFVLAPLSAVFRVLIGTAGVFGTPLTTSLLRFVLAPVARAGRGRRLHNYRKVFGPFSRKRFAAIDSEYSRYLVRMNADFILRARVTPAAFRTLINLRGREHLDRALREGRGAVVIGTHVGNWTNAAALLSAWGYPVTVAAYELPIRSLEDHLQRSSHRFGLTVIAVGDGVPSAARAVIRRKEIFLLLFDVSVRPRRSARLPLGNATILVDPGTIRMVLMLGAPILRISSAYDAAFNTTVTLHPLSVPTPAPDEEQWQTVARRWLSGLHDELCERPGQWWAWPLVDLRPVEVSDAIPASEAVLL